uniref:Uncharacterized protein n=1 Tax=viral metagenome TaxID=1070528 RepID=A0A6C0B932_9ZZZZ
MELQIQLEEDHIKMENIQFQKMIFLFNALNEGWTIKKRKESYIFTKNHEGKKEVFLDSYLMSFLKNNFDTTKSLLS